MTKKEYEEYLKFLEQNGVTEEEDDAMTEIMHDHDFDGW